jgi:ankyrin repeat protein
MDNEYRNCLYYALKKNNYKLYWYLIEQNAEIEKPDIKGKKHCKLKGNTLLHHAAILKNKKIILNLLLKGLDPHLSNKQNQNVFDVSPDMKEFIEQICQV